MFLLLNPEVPPLGGDGCPAFPAWGWDKDRAPGESCQHHLSLSDYLHN